MLREIADLADLVVACYRAGGKVMLCGNGGSADLCSHVAGELVGRFLFDRPPLAAISLSADHCVVTALANDYGYNEVFARQVVALGRPADILVAVSTSGNSENVCRAARAARRIGMTVIGMTGSGGGQLAPLCERILYAPTSRVPEIQQQHLHWAHEICALVESKAFRTIDDGGSYAAAHTEAKN